MLRNEKMSNIASSNDNETTKENDMQDINKEIAERLNINVRTVQRAINNEGKMSTILNVKTAKNNILHRRKLNEFKKNVDSLNNQNITCVDTGEYMKIETNFKYIECTYIHYINTIVVQTKSEVVDNMTELADELSQVRELITIANIKTEESVLNE